MTKRRASNRPSNVFELAQFRRAPKTPAPASPPGTARIYIEQDVWGGVSYCLVNLSSCDMLEMLRALLLLGERLVEFHHG